MGMRVAIVAGAAPFPEMSPETDGEGHYRLGGVSPGTFQVAVHSRGGERIGFQSVVVKSGETAMLNFSASVGTEDKAQGQPGPSGSPGKDTSPAATGGGTPRASLTYEGLAYYQDPLRTDEAASITKDDFELVGSTMESNTLAPGESLNIYKLKEGEEGCLYTLEPGHSFQNEDGATITIEAEWIRWTAGDSN